jgi:hypothetical protein
MARRQPPNDPWSGLAALGIAAFAVVCCTALPLLAALAGSVAIGTVLGVGAGLVAAVVLVGLALARVRRRRACEPPRPASPSQADRVSPRGRSRGRAP